MCAAIPCATQINESLANKMPLSNMSQIIDALEYLRDEAQKNGEDEISEIIDATFKICLNSYYTVKRIELEKQICLGSRAK